MWAVAAGGFSDYLCSALPCRKSGYPSARGQFGNPAKNNTTYCNLMVWASLLWGNHIGSQVNDEDVSWVILDAS